MADGWISGLLRQFFWWALIVGDSEGASRWDGGEGREGGSSKTKLSCLEQEKPPKVSRRSPYHTTRPRAMGQQFQVMTTQLVPSIGAILLIVTSQGP